jgi:hypothetical protein
MGVDCLRYRACLCRDSVEVQSYTSLCDVFKKRWQRRTLPRSCPRSTIRAGDLNCRVRDGSGCTLTALVTNTLCLTHTYCLLSPHSHRAPPSTSTHPIPPLLLRSLGFRVLLQSCSMSAFTSAESLHSQVSLGLLSPTHTSITHFCFLTLSSVVLRSSSSVPPQASALRHHISKPSTISTGLLHMLPRFHIPPIY